MDAINHARFEGLTFKEIYDSDNFELIDISYGIYVNLI